MNIPEDQRPPSLEQITQALGNVIKEARLKVKFADVETFVAFNCDGAFLHSLSYVDDPLFYEAANATLGLEDDDVDLVVSKEPATLTGYLLKNADGEVVGFTCFESQVQANDE